MTAEQSLAYNSLISSPAILPTAALLLLFFHFSRPGQPWQRAMLLAAITCAIFVVFTTEILSFFHLITRTAIVFTWAGFVENLLMFALFRRILRRKRAGERIDRPELPAPQTLPSNWFRRLQTLFAGGAMAMILIPLIVLLLAVGAVAVVAPPNNWDSMTYHMARVAHWIQEQNISHFPTQIGRQVFMPPWSEWMILHLQLLSNSDRFANSVQWAAMSLSLVAGSYVARLLGANRWGQLFAAVVCFTIPMGILQSTSTQNDVVEGCWMLIFVATGIDFLRSIAPRNSLEFPRRISGFFGRLPLREAACGAALGLALLTKGTAYTFVPVFALLFAVVLLWRLRLRAIYSLFVIAGVALLVNANHYQRNYFACGNPLGPGKEDPTSTYGWKYTTDLRIPSALESTLVRNLSMQFGKPDFLHLTGIVSADQWLAARAKDWGWLEPFATRNRALNDWVLKWHKDRGLDPSDPNTSWVGQTFSIPNEWNHEDAASNPIHTALIFLAVILLPWPRWRDRKWAMLYLAGIAGAFVMFSLILRWQPWHTRLMLPILMLASPLIGTAIEKALSPWLGFPIALALLALSIPWIINNKSRPFFATDTPTPAKWTEYFGPRSVFVRPRADQMFFNHSNLKAPYEQAARTIRDSGGRRIGLVTNIDDWEYPLWVVLRDQLPNLHIEHIHVTNESADLAKIEPFASYSPDLIVTLRGNITVQKIAK